MNRFPAVTEIALRQAGVISRRQLRKAKISPDAIKRALASAVLLRFHRGVFRLPGAPISDQTRIWAAMLWCNFQAVLSHRSAGWWCWKLEGLGRKAPPLVELLTWHKSNWSAPAGICVRRALTLKAGVDTTVRNGFACTTLPRTLIDLAAVLNPQALEQAFDSAVRTVDDLDTDVLALLERLGPAGRSGNAAITNVATRNPTLKTGSPLEIIVRDAMTAADIKQPLPQVVLDDRHRDQIGVIDFAWPERQVVLFVQSNRWHRSRGAFELDHEQWNALVATGWRVLTITDRRLQNQSDHFFDELRAVLATDPDP